MKIQTKKQLLSFLKEKCAYSGKDTVEDVLAFCDSEGIEIDAEQVKGLFAKKVSISIAADAGEEVEVSQPEAKGECEEDGEVAVEKSAKAESVRKKKALISQSHGVIESKSVRSTGSIARKAYNAKASNGYTKFHDADTMEAFNAAYRLYVSDMVPSLKNYGQKAADLEIVGKDGTELVNSLGGALFVDSFNPTVINMTEPFGVARLLANNVDMTGGNYVQARRTGNASFSHVAQGSAATATDATYDNVQLVPKQIMCLIKTNRQLFENAAVNVGDEIASTILEAYHNRIDNDYILGDGTSTYGGQMGLANALPSAAYISASGNAWISVVAGDWLNAVGKVEYANLSRCAWLMSRQAFVNGPLRITLALGGNKAADFLGARYLTQSESGLMSGANAELLGFPVYFSDRCPTASASASKFAYFGDFFGGSMVGHRKQLEVAPSDHAGFSSNQVWTRGVAEIAVNIHGDGKGSTYGPIVCLKTT